MIVVSPPDATRPISNSEQRVKRVPVPWCRLRTRLRSPSLIRRDDRVPLLDRRHARPAEAAGGFVRLDLLDVEPAEEVALVGAVQHAELHAGRDVVGAAD